jgi:hypothetical protein
MPRLGRDRRAIGAPGCPVAPVSPGACLRQAPPLLPRFTGHPAASILVPCSPPPLAGTNSAVATAKAPKIRSGSRACGHEDCLPIADRFEAPQDEPSSASSRPSIGRHALFRMAGDEVELSSIVGQRQPSRSLPTPAIRSS